MSTKNLRRLSTVILPKAIYLENSVRNYKGVATRRLRRPRETHSRPLLAPPRRDVRSDLNLTRIEQAQLLREKFPVATDEFPVEINFPAAVIWTLNADHIPVNLASVSVVSFLVGLSRSEME